MAMTKWTIAGAAGAVLLGGVALAQDGGHAMAGKMRMADTRAGAAAMVAEMFARADTDKDGAITTAERDAMRMKHREQRHERIERRMGDPKEAFARLDTNKDGMLSPDEFAKGRDLRIEKRIEKRKAGGYGGHGGHGGKGGGHGMMGMMFSMADANRDGRVTLAEAQAMAMKHFDMADANRDGTISAEERAAMHAKMRAHHEMKPAS